MLTKATTDIEDILARTLPLWENLRGGRLFLTGGTGFFGRWLLQSFVHANERLGLKASATVLTRDPAGFRTRTPELAAHPALNLHGGELRAFRFPDGVFDLCVHAATEGHPRVIAQDPLAAFDVNVEGTRRVLEFARTAGVRRFLFTSSGAIYGPQPPELERIAEHCSRGPDPTDAQSTYGIPGEAKRAAESLCVLYARQFGMETVIARCFTFVGPGLPLDGRFAIGNFIRDALTGGPIDVQGDGTPFRSYLYAADLAVWLWTILLRGESGQAYNVGSEVAVSIAAAAQAVSESVAPRPPIRVARKPDSAQRPSRYVPSTLKARTSLGLEETVDLREAIRRTIVWHRNDRRPDA